MITRRCPDVSDAHLFKSPSISNFTLPALPHFSLPLSLCLSLSFSLLPYTHVNLQITDSGPIGPELL